MKSPRFLAALAMAAVLTTGATTAHAAFTQTGGNSNNGQTPMQKADEYKADLTNLPNQKLEADGDISVDGRFTKTVNNFPKPDKDGHYLRVTMPIKMDFTYDVDTDTMTSAEGVVVNNSVHATNTSTQQKLNPKKVTMTLVDFADNTKGTSTMTSGVEFVTDVNASTTTDKVLLPFELKVESKTGQVQNYSIANIQKKASANNGIAPITIEPDSTLKLKIDKISGQSLGNTDLITNQTSLTSHSLKLKFEYDGN